MKKLIIENKNGIRAQAAALLARLTMWFDVMILVQCNNRVAQASEIINVLLVCALGGGKIKVLIEGNDSKIVMPFVAEIFENNGLEVNFC